MLNMERRRKLPRAGRCRCSFRADPSQARRRAGRADNAQAGHAPQDRRGRQPAVGRVSRRARVGRAAAGPRGVLSARGALLLLLLGQRVPGGPDEHAPAGAAPQAGGAPAGGHVRARPAHHAARGRARQVGARARLRPAAQQRRQRRRAARGARARLRRPQHQEGGDRALPLQAAAVQALQGPRVRAEAHPLQARRHAARDRGKG
eukprot:IDg14593t1